MADFEFKIKPGSVLDQFYQAAIVAERERIIKLIWDNAEVITNQYFYHNALIGEPTAFLIALIKGENK